MRVPSLNKKLNFQKLTVKKLIDYGFHHSVALKFELGENEINNFKFTGNVLKIKTQLNISEHHIV
jgi:hypothetical protein